MSILVTGAAGFLGRYLVDHLRKTTQTPVIGVIRRADQMADQITAQKTAKPSPKQSMVQANRRAVDLTDTAAVQSLIQEIKPTQVYHLAGHSRVTNTVAMKDYFAANYLTTVRLIEALLALKTPVRLFLASTIHIYGNTEEVATEYTPAQPVNDYGFTKYIAEEFVRKKAQENPNLSVLIGRLYNCFGPGQAPGFVTPDLCRKIAALPSIGEGRLQVGPTSTFRRFLDVRDAVSLLASLMAATIDQRIQIINIASPHEVQIRDLITLLLGIAKKRAQIESSEDNSANRLFGIRINCDRMKQLIPNARFRPLEETLREMYAS